MTANVSVIVSEADNAVHVPTAAVTGSGANASVTVLQNKKQARVPVVAGLNGDSSTQIVSGLKSGATVVLPTVAIAAPTGGGTPGGFGGGAGGGGAGRFGGGGIPG
jgi:hypothetical protein